MKPRELVARERAVINRYRLDFPLFAKRCLKIRVKAGGPLQALRFNKAQSYIHERLEEQRARTGRVRAILLKGRQMGSTTYVEGRFYHRVTTTFGARAFILTHMQDATDNVFEMVERYHENNNPILKPATGKANAKEMNFPGLESGYRVGTAGSIGVGRSETIQLFHGSEVSYWNNAATHATGVLQAVPNELGTEVILESTANGLGNYFSDEWAKAVSGASQFIAIFVPWFWDEGYRLPIEPEFQLTDDEVKYAIAHRLDKEQMAWRRAKIVELKEEWKFMQEYPATPEEAFQSSGEGTFIKPVKVALARRGNVVPENYIPTVIGVDPARGGRDSTAIIDRQGRRAGGKIKERWDIADAMQLAGKLVLVIKAIRPRKVIIDATEGTGGAVCDRLTELGYGKIIEPVRFSQSAIEDDLYLNKRAEMWAAMRDWLDNPLGVQIPDDDELQAEMCAPIWGTGATKHNSSGQLQIEAKEHIVKRLTHSPDLADALAMTFAIPIIGTKPDMPEMAAVAAADARAGY